MNLKSTSIMVTFERKLPIGIQTFEKIRKGDYLYVDKTELVWKLACSSVPNFLSRPRRFGKSLLLSLSNLILKDVRTYLKAWLWRSWRTNGRNIQRRIWI